MNEKCEMKKKNGMGPDVSKARRRHWVQKESIGCTKRCNKPKLASEKALPRLNEWAYPDVDPIANAGYPLFDSISELNDFVTSFERENADYIQQLTDNCSIKTKAMITTEPIIYGGL